MIEYRSQRLKKLFRSWRLECYLSKRYERLMKKNITTMWQQEARQSRLLAFCESLSSIMHYQSVSSVCVNLYSYSYSIAEPDNIPYASADA